MGVQKAPKVATLLGQTSEELRKAILNRIQRDNIGKVQERINAENSERQMILAE